MPRSNSEAAEGISHLQNQMSPEQNEIEEKQEVKEQKTTSLTQSKEQLAVGTDNLSGLTNSMLHAISCVCANDYGRFVAGLSFHMG
jgi:hypothetical protein